MSNWELNRELAEYENDKKKIEFELNKHKEQYAEILKNEIGKEKKSKQIRMLHN